MAIFVIVLIAVLVLAFALLYAAGLRQFSSLGAMPIDLSAVSILIVLIALFIAVVIGVALLQHFRSQ